MIRPVSFNVLFALLGATLTGVACSQPLGPRELMGRYQAVGSSYASVVTETVLYELLSNSLDVGEELMVSRILTRETTLATGEVRFRAYEQRMTYETDGLYLRTRAVPCGTTSCPDDIAAVGISTPDFVMIADVLVAMTKGGRGTQFERTGGYPRLD